MCLDGQTGAFAVLNKSFQPSRKLNDRFVVCLTGTEHLMTGKEHSNGLQLLSVQRSHCVCKRRRTFEEGEIVGADNFTKVN